MNKTQKTIFALTMLASVGHVAADNSVGCNTTTYYSARSQGVNAVREMVGWQDLINRCNEDKFYGSFAVVLEYGQTFRNSRICECLFGNGLSNALTSTSNCNTSCNTGCKTECEPECGDCSINISGSCVTGRGANDWLADYFGLPTDFQSTVSFSPRVRNFVADLEFYVGLDEWAEGLYFRLNVPICHTKWSLRPCESDITPGVNPYLAGYFGPDVVGRDELNVNALAFFSGQVPDLTEQDPSVTFQPLRFSKWGVDDCSGDHKKTRVADLSAVLGYNFVCTENGYFGLNLRASAPTGNRPEGEFLFEAIVGNGHHWTLGGGLNAHYVLWSSEEDDSNFSFYLDANVSHMFNAKQCRSFDLCEAGSNSRYMLAQQLTANVEGLEGNPATTTDGVSPTSGYTPSDKQFNNVFAPVANLTGSSVNVKVAVQGDVALKFSYASDCGFSWDLGYNFWGKSCERVEPRKCNNSNGVDLSNWALKGDAYVYGFESSTSATPNAPFALAATESGATIFTGTNLANTGMCDDDTNPNIDNAQFAYIQVAPPALTPAEPLFGLTGEPDTDTADETRTSIQPVTLADATINYSGNRGISNKIFTHLNYTWKDNEDWVPFIGIGASAEFGQSCRKGCESSCDTNACNTSSSCSTNACETTPCGDVKRSCVSCALSQWAVWVKGGISFN